MKSNQETVFEILAEGGSLSIQRISTSNGTNFIYHHSEMDASEEGLYVSKNGEYDNFSQPFSLINNKYPWYLLHLSIIHDDYKDYVVAELIKTLNSKKVHPNELEHSKSDLEDTLNISLEYGYAPVSNGLRKIIVTALTELTEYDYESYTNDPSEGQKFKMKGSYKMWTEEECYTASNMEILKASRTFETIGKLEVSSNTIIIKDEFNHISYIFPSDKYFVSTGPFKNSYYSWFTKPSRKFYLG